MVMFYALPGEERSKTTVMRVVMDMRKPFRNSTEALAPGSYLNRTGFVGDSMV
jgi:hypothetical protein